MGIIGLEKFIDSIQEGLVNNNAIINTRLGVLKDKLVVDGNQLPYIILDTLKSSLYSGNYDDIYNFGKSLLTKLKPYFHIIIFDGVNEDFNKSEKKFGERICKFMNIEIDRFKKSLDLKTHFDLLRSSRNLFYRSILYEILDDLGIKYMMSSGKNTHLISSYANGKNDLNQTYTVISKDSYFNMIDLSGGYVTWKYAIHKLVNNDNLDDETQLPVFYLKKVLEFYGISHKTWMYFGVLNGDYDLQLNRNNKYFLSKKINTRFKDFNFDLIYHLKENESKNVNNNFSQIRNAYEKDDLIKVDKLIEKFEMKANQDNTDKFYNDFDKSIEIFKTLNVNFLNCLIEDPNELTCFSIVQKNDIFNMVYYLLTSQYNLKRISTTEFYRNKELTKFEDCVFKKVLKIDKPANTLIFDFLTTINEKLIDKNNNVLSNDNLSILMTTLSIWYEWLIKNDYKTKISISPEIFVDSILTNLLILDLKQQLPDNQNHNNTENSTCIGKIILELKTNASNINEINRIKDLYDQIIKHNNSKLNEIEFFLNDIKIVHRLNEFQTMYYSLCLLSKILDFRFEYLSPKNFFNGKFLYEYINKTDSEAIKTIINLLNKIEPIKTVRDKLKLKFKEYHKNIYEIKLDDISLKLSTIKFD
jgi:hypothetical protein